jgi:hypothetical protein
MKRLIRSAFWIGGFAVLGISLNYSGLFATAPKTITVVVPDFQLRKIQNNAFTLGEKLTFDISYGPVTAGVATMSIPSIKYINGHKAYETRVEANSKPSFDWIFKVRDRYSTFLDVDGIFPWRFEQMVREGKYSRDFNAFFDPEEQTAETSDGKKYKTPMYVQDIVSAFYYVRTLDLTRMHKGDKIELQNFYKDKSHPLVVTVLGHQRVKTDAGTFNCVVIEPNVMEGGLFKNEGSIRVWMTDDQNHMPVKMLTKVIIGSIEAKLTKFEGVKSNLTARVN